MLCFEGHSIGTIIHNIEMKPGKGGAIAVTGSFAQLNARDGKYAIIKFHQEKWGWSYNV